MSTHPRPCFFSLRTTTKVTAVNKGELLAFGAVVIRTDGVVGDERFEEFHRYFVPAGQISHSVSRELGVVKRKGKIYVGDYEEPHAIDDIEVGIKKFLNWLKLVRRGDHRPYVLVTHGHSSRSRLLGQLLHAYARNPGKFISGFTDSVELASTVLIPLRPLGGVGKSHKSDEKRKLELNALSKKYQLGNVRKDWRSPMRQEARTIAKVCEKLAEEVGESRMDVFVRRYEGWSLEECRQT